MRPSGEGVASRTLPAPGEDGALGDARKARRDNRDATRSAREVVADEDELVAGECSELEVVVP